MNEKSLEVLSAYDWTVQRISRGRGGMILSTDAGPKLFLECSKSNAFYEREHLLTQAVVRGGFQYVDTYVCNKDGNCVTVAEDGRRYIVKNWTDGRECNVKSMDDVISAITSLGQVHQALHAVSLELLQTPAVETPVEVMAAQAEQDVEIERKPGQITDRFKDSRTMPDIYERHTKELKMAMNYLRNKKKKSDFEQLAYEHIGAFYEEAGQASALLHTKSMTERLERVVSMYELCHGSFHYHNILMDTKGTMIVNFDQYRNDCQIRDLYQFMRKILEKCDWDIETAYKMIDVYDQVHPIGDTDRKLLSAFFAFPEKFWKIINYYLNANKAWIPPKNLEKLQKVIAQNGRRQAFLATLGS